jgi:hypothetical protein
VRIPRRELFEKVKETLSDPKVVEDLLEARPEKALLPIAQRLGAWQMLHGVPFNYLVPDESMLPPESLRFFHVDRDWIAALIDGACSPGRRADEFGLLVETLVMPIVERSACDWARKLRLLDDEEECDDGIAEITGFLLRSQAVAGWKNLGVNAYAKGSTKRLPLLRFERLAPGVLIAMFEGVVHQLDIHEAPQGLHFGVDPGSKKSLRSDKAGSIGAPLGKKAELAYRDPHRRLLDVAATARNVSNALGADGSLTSSDFALQMVEGVGMVSFFFEADR